MALDIGALIKSLFERLSFSIGLAVCATSGAAVFLPSLREPVGDYRIVAILVFIFSFTWSFWEAAKWAKSTFTKDRRQKLNDRSALSMSLSHSLHNYERPSGRQAFEQRGSEVASEISQYYARLKHMGVKTPDIDPVDGPWDWDLHVSFLKDLLPYLTHVPLSETRDLAKKLVDRKARRSEERREPRSRY